MLILLSLLACSVGASSLGFVSSQPYLEGMWEARAMTCGAGLEEALTLYEAGDRSEASELVQAVYEGSYEPELEPLIRELVDPSAGLEVEYRFGLLREAMKKRDKARVRQEAEALQVALNTHAAELDELRAVIN